MHHNESPSPVQYRIGWGPNEKEHILVMSMSAVIKTVEKRGLLEVSLQARRTPGNQTGACHRWAPYRAWSQIPTVRIPVEMLRLILACREEMPVQ